MKPGVRVFHPGRAVKAFLVPPGAPFEVHGPVFGQVHVVRVVQPAPGLGAIEGMVRIGKRRLQAEFVPLVRAQVFDGLIADPGRVVPRHRQSRVIGLRRVAERGSLV